MSIHGLSMRLKVKKKVQLVPESFEGLSKTTGRTLSICVQFLIFAHYAHNIGYRRGRVYWLTHAC